MRKTLIWTLLLILPAVSVFADDVVWTGVTGDNRWDNPDNWDTGNVPCVYDDVSIPAGTPVCQVSVVTVNGLVNEGTIEPTLSGGVINVEGSLSNNGSIGKEDTWVYLNSSSMSNSGTVQGSYVSVDASDIENYPGGVIAGHGGENNHPAVSLSGSSSITNHGSVTGGNTGYPFTKGGRIDIATSSSGSVSNLGNIKGGDGAGYGDGGSVRIRTGTLWNVGHVGSGNGVNGKDGTLTAYARKVDNEGTMKGGDSMPPVLKSQREIIIGNVSLVADSIAIHPDMNFIEADTLRIICRTLLVNDINMFGGIWANSCSLIYTTADGSADFSGTHQSGGILTEPPDGYHHIFSNNIIAPPEGLDYIFLPDPVTFPADLTITGGFITSMDEVGAEVSSGLLNITMQNHSTASKVLNYTVSSTRGWVSPTSGSTELLSPFAFADLLVDYTIPEDTAAGETDAVVAILTIGEAFADTSYSTIYCVDGVGSGGIDEQEVPMPFLVVECCPNPFSLGTDIRFQIPKAQKPNQAQMAGSPQLVVYDISGRVVRDLSDNIASCIRRNGSAIAWDGRDDSGDKLPSGVYCLRLRAEGYGTASKIIITRQ